ncbi:P1 family peptidase, partial [Achromobacter xylosoxidans]|nr:P1 family peptidase [Achromobacter xylosoxidans]
APHRSPCRRPRPGARLAARATVARDGGILHSGAWRHAATSMDKQALDQPRIGKLQAGALDSICDVGDITVGHSTLDDGALQTGVTVVRPHGGNLFLDKVPAAATVLNGFGKSTGLVQVQELGVLETPIALTNTFGVGTVANAQIRAAVAATPEIGRGMSTVNPLVFECN